MAVKLLMIDDDPDILEILQVILAGEGYEIITAGTAPSPEDIRKLRPDILLIDDWLPDSEYGSSVCLRLKSDPATSNIRIILMSAHNHLRTTASECRADNRLAKPFDVDHVIALISSEAGKIQTVS